MPDTFPSHETMAVVIDGDLVRVFSPLNDADALALQGCSAEDPATWKDVALFWPRYKFDPENAEFADGLPIRLVSLTEAGRLLADAPAWFVLDLNGRRVLTGGQFPLLRLRHTPSGEGDKTTHITVIPPWWELEDDAEDPFDSPWKSTFIGEENIPGDNYGHLRTAFQVAELVGWLKMAKADQSEVDMLNAAFRDYRMACLPSQRIPSAESFKNVLEQLAAKYQELTGRAADLQSRIDERQRASAVGEDDFDDSDMPF